MTLTTEQLRERAESLGLDFFIERRAGIWVKEWFENGCTSATAEEVMMWSMLANREAQPAGYSQVQRDMMKDILVRKLGGNLLGEKLCMDDIHAATMELIKAGFRLYTAPPAPAVPEEMKRDPDADVFDPGFMNGWNACRAAMLKGERP